MKDSIGRERSPIVKRKDWDRIIARVASEDKTIPQIAREEGCNDRTLRRRCRARGILKVTRKDEVESQLDKVLRLYESGRSCSQISNELGLAIEAVIRVIKESPCEWREGHVYNYVVLPGSDQEKEICSRYPEMSIENLGDLYGIKYTTMRHILRRAGKNILPRGPGSHRKKVEDA